MAWTEERIKHLHELYVNQGLSAGRIADILGGCTRNAVIGKVSRMGWVKGVPEQTKRARARVANRIAPVKPKAKPHGWFPVNLANRAPSPEQVAKDQARMADLDSAIPPERRVKLVDLEPHHCRFPLGEVGTSEFGFCPEDHMPGVPYCKDHYARCLTPVVPATRAVGGVTRVKAPANDLEDA